MIHSDSHQSQKKQKRWCAALLPNLSFKDFPFLWMWSKKFSKFQTGIPLIFEHWCHCLQWLVFSSSGISQTIQPIFVACKKQLFQSSFQVNLWDGEFNFWKCELFSTQISTVHISISLGGTKSLLDVFCRDKRIERGLVDGTNSAGGKRDIVCRSDVVTDDFARCLGGLDFIGTF